MFTKMKELDPVGGGGVLRERLLDLPMNTKYNIVTLVEMQSQKIDGNINTYFEFTFKYAPVWVMFLLWVPTARGC